MKTFGKYILSLNPIAGSDKVWLPKIGKNDLVRLRENDNPVVIAHDWVSPGSYEYGAWLYSGGKIVPLQDHALAKIVNEDEDFIFELDSSSHKGLIAIEITQEPEGNEAFFVMEKRFDQDAEKVSICLYLEPYVSEQLQDQIIKAVGGDKEDVDLSVQREWITVYAEDYDQMLAHLPVELI